MSATLAVDELINNSHVFPSPPPVIQIASRQYPVNIKFLRRTPDNYLACAFKMACRLHLNKPVNGAILIFVPSRSEVLTLVSWLKKKFPIIKNTKKSSFDHTSITGNDNTSSNSFEDETKSEKRFLELFQKLKDPYSNSHHERDKKEAEELEFEESCRDENLENFNIESVTSDTNHPLHVLPLYGLMSSTDQEKIFESSPNGYRLCVVSTNVAETSITIPNVKFVIDTGKCKRKLYDRITGASTFEVTWCSKASAAQRAGRSGRTSSGEVYRLYSSAVYENDFQEFSTPDILMQPIDGLVLQMKCMGIYKVENFPFLTSPTLESISTAEKLLYDLGALQEKSTSNGKIAFVPTDLGKSLTKIPLSPRFSRILHESMKRGVAGYILFLLSCYSVRELRGNYNQNPNNEEPLEKLQPKKNILNPGAEIQLGDFMCMLKSVAACEYANSSNEMCLKMGVRKSALIEAQKLRRQISHIVYHKEETSYQSQEITPPSSYQIMEIAKSILSGFPDHIARRRVVEHSDLVKDSTSEKKSKNMTNYECLLVEEDVFIHPMSVLAKMDQEWIVFMDLFKAKKVYMKEVMQIDPTWIAEIFPEKCQFGNALNDRFQPFFDLVSGKAKCYHIPFYGSRKWSLPICSTSFQDKLDSCRWFLRFLLEGKVFPCMKQYSEQMCSSPSIITKPWFDLNPACINIIDCLLNSNKENPIDNVESLQRNWKSNSKFLLNEYLQWFDENNSIKEKIISNWPPEF